MYHILIVEDEESIAKVIEVTLSLVEDYVSTVCYDGITARKYLEKKFYDLILLDVMLPGIDGFTLMEEIRPREIPVIFITARLDLADRVKGLNIGAEDYILKPFEPMELLARVDVVRRRYQKEQMKLMRYGDIFVDIEKHRAFLEGNPVELRPKEFALLVYFIRNQNIIIRPEQLMADIWGCEYLGETRTVYNHIQQLRKKMHLEEDLMTIPRVGFCLKSERSRG